jgi:hypothetical protein
MGQSLSLFFSINPQYAQIYSSGSSILLLENENDNCASSNLILKPGKFTTHFKITKTIQENRRNTLSINCSWQIITRGKPR